METGKKQTRSGSKWYRLPRHNLNIATADHLFRTHEPEGTHSLGDGLRLPFNRLQQEVLTALWAQTQTAEGSFSVRLSKAERSGTAASLQHLAPEPPSSTLLSSGDGKAKYVLSMWADAAPSLSTVTAGTCGSSPKTFTRRSQLRGALRKHKLHWQHGVTTT